MEISNNQSCYVNPNTRQITSNIKNTAIKDREAYYGVMSQYLLSPVEKLVQVLRTPIKLADKSSLNRQSNSINIASGMRIAVNDCYILTVKTSGVEVSHTEGYNPYDQEAYVRAQWMADSLTTLLRNACGIMKNVAHSSEDYSEENPVIKVNVTRQGKTEEYHININEVNPRNATEIEMFALCSYADAKGMGRGCWESLKSLKLIATHSIISKKAR